MMKNKLNDESGVFLILTSVIALSLFFGFIYLAANTFLVRTASTHLRARADEICSILANNDLHKVDEAMSIFAEYIDEFNNSNNPFPGIFDITEAHLYIPTMPPSATSFATADGLDTYLTSNAGSTLYSKNENIEGVPFVDINADNPRDSSVINCNSSTECFLHTDVDRTSYTGNQKRIFPSTIWDNIDNATNSVGCVLKGQISLFFNDGEDRLVQGKSIYKKTIRGSFPNHMSRAAHASGSSTNRIEEAPGLTIAISPHLTTDVNHPQFRFPLLLPNPLTTAWQNRPTSETNWWWEDPSTLDSRYEGGNHDYDPVITLSPPPTSSSPTFLREVTDIETTLNDASSNRIKFLYPEKIGLDLNSEDFHQMLVSCSNPLVLARNLLTASLIELASRNGQLRSMTEVLLTGTQNRNISDLNSLPATINPPIILNSFGDDLVTKNDHPLPLLNSFDTTVTDSLKPLLGESKKPTTTSNGSLNPYSNSPLSSEINGENWIRHHSLIAGQLRYCSHLYWNDSLEAQVKLQRYFYGTEAWTNALLHIPPDEDSFYEPPYYRDAFADRTNNSYHEDSLYKSNWDQGCPWSGLCENNLARNYSISKLLAVMGSIQSCPYEQQLPFSPTTQTCTKPSLADDSTSPISPTYDLRPDTLGTIRYMNNSLNGLLNTGSYPTSTSALQQGTLNTKSALVYITHQRLSIEEADQIRAIVTSSNWEDRHLTVVWLSPEPAQYIQEGRDRFVHAFNIGNEADSASNQLIILSPYHGAENQIEYQPYDTHGAGHALMNYWMDSLNLEHRNYIPLLARKIYNSKLRIKMGL